MDREGYFKRVYALRDAVLEVFSSVETAGLFPVDVARPLLAATPSDWKLMRWIEALPVEELPADAGRLGEGLLLLDPRVP